MKQLHFMVCALITGILIVDIDSISTKECNNLIFILNNKKLI